MRNTVILDFLKFSKATARHDGRGLILDFLKGRNKIDSGKTPSPPDGKGGASGIRKKNGAYYLSDSSGAHRLIGYTQDSPWGKAGKAFGAEDKDSLIKRIKELYERNGIKKQFNVTLRQFRDHILHNFGAPLDKPDSKLMKLIETLK